MAHSENCCGQPPDAGRGPSDADLPGPVIDSEKLLTGRNEVFIRHDGEIYRLRRTSRGKLIMTK